MHLATGDDAVERVRLPAKGGTQNKCCKEDIHSKDKPENFRVKDRYENRVKIYNKIYVSFMKLEVANLRY